jgi:hypothetical protein
MPLEGILSRTEYCNKNYCFMYKKCIPLQQNCDNKNLKVILQKVVKQEFYFADWLQQKNNQEFQQKSLQQNYVFTIMKEWANN